MTAAQQQSTATVQPLDKSIVVHLRLDEHCWLPSPAVLPLCKQRACLSYCLTTKTKTGPHLWTVLDLPQRETSRSTLTGFA